MKTPTPSAKTVDLEPFMPPMRDGVTASLVFLPKLISALSTFEYLCQQFPHVSITQWQQRFDDGLVFSKNGHILTTATAYLSEQHIYYYRHLAHEKTVPFEHQILFENDEFMVVDKPHFLTVSPTGQYVQQTLVTRLKQQTLNPYLTPIHRLDRETAGVILISKNPNTRGLYQQLFADKKVQKTYHAIAPYTSNLKFPLRFEACMKKGDPFYIMQITQGEINSITDIACLQHNTIWAKYQLSPVTGKQHQLRVHMNALGLSLKYDRFYPEVIHHQDEQFEHPLQLLAKHIAFTDPISGQDFQFSSAQDLSL